MTLDMRRALRLSLAALTLLPAAALAQGTRADYDRALALRERYDRAAINIAGAVTWIENTHAFWYRRSIAGGFEFVRVDADTREKRPLFDHAKIAASLSQGSSKPYTAVALPFNTLTFRDGEKTFEVTVDNATWQCTTAESACKKSEPQTARPGGPFACAAPTPADRPRVSPDGKSEAFVQNYNLVVKRRWRREGHAAQLRRIRGQLLPALVDRVVAGFAQGRGVPRQAGLSPDGHLRRVVARGSAAAEDVVSLLRQTG